VTGGEGGDRSDRWMVGGAPPERLAALADEIEADPAVELVEVKGDRRRPSLLVVTGDAPAAERLRAQLGPGGVVEPDSLLDQL
jgi:malonyl CoA-acyl carrier protein transacylase